MVQTVDMLTRESVHLRRVRLEIQRCGFPKDYGENSPLNTGKGDDTH